MKTKKKAMILLLILVFIIVVIVIINNGNKKSDNQIVEFNEYTPQEEISAEQLRQTLVTLYFKNKETGEIVPEARLIDSKILLNDPYIQLIALLIEGPKNENLIKLIPEGTVVNNVEINKGIVYIDFSIEFTKTGTMGAEEEIKIISSIVNTLVELTEVSGVKIIINGEENKCFESGSVNFNQIFTRDTINTI